MKISIIIPVYNTEKFISRAIDSILSQDYKDFEIICIDDGSVDNSAKIIKQKANDYPCIKYYYQKNQGPGIARKNGFNKSSGELVYFLDSDDYLIDNTAFTKIVDVYSKFNPDVLFFNIMVKKDEAEYIISPFNVDDSKKGFNELEKLSNLYINANLYSKVLKRSLLDETLFVDSNTFEDFYTSYLYLDRCNNYYYLDEVFYCVYHGKDNGNHLQLVDNIEKKNKRLKIINLTYSKINTMVIKTCIANYCSQIIEGACITNIKYFFDSNNRKNNKIIKNELKNIIKIINESKFKYVPKGKFKFIKRIMFNLFLITHK